MFLQDFQPTIGLEPTPTGPPTLASSSRWSALASVIGSRASHKRFYLHIKKIPLFSGTFSRLSDLNQSPARYECAALPDELSRRERRNSYRCNMKIISFFLDDCKDFTRFFSLIFYQIFQKLISILKSYIISTLLSEPRQVKWSFYVREFRIKMDERSKTDF